MAVTDGVQVVANGSIRSFMTNTAPTAAIWARPLSSSSTSSASGTLISSAPAGYVIWSGPSTQASGSPYGTGSVATYYTNANNIKFSGMPASTMTGIELRADATTSTRRLFCNFSSSLSVTAGYTVTIPAGSLKLSVETLDASTYNTYQAGLSTTGMDRYLRWLIGEATQPTSLSAALTTGAFGSTAQTTPPTEVTGGSYARQALSAWTNVYFSNFTGTNTTLTFSGLPAATVTGTTIFDQDGNYIMFGEFTSSITVGAGGEVIVPKQYLFYEPSR